MPTCIGIRPADVTIISPCFRRQPPRRPSRWPGPRSSPPAHPAPAVRTRHPRTRACRRLDEPASASRRPRRRRRHASPPPTFRCRRDRGPRPAAGRAQRIVSLATGVGETLAALGVADRVVGRDETSDVPAIDAAPVVTKAHADQCRARARPATRPRPDRRGHLARRRPSTRSAPPACGSSRCPRRGPWPTSVPARAPSPRPSASLPRPPTPSSPRPPSSSATPPTGTAPRGGLPLPARHLSHLPDRRQGLGRRRPHRGRRRHRRRSRVRPGRVRPAHAGGLVAAGPRHDPRHDEGPGVGRRHRRTRRPAGCRADDRGHGSGGSSRSTTPSCCRSARAPASSSPRLSAALAQSPRSDRTLRWAWAALVLCCRRGRRARRSR